MSDPIWADTPAESDYVAAALLDHQDHTADRTDHACVDVQWPGCACPPSGHNDLCWLPHIPAAYQAANQTRRTT